MQTFIRGADIRFTATFVDAAGVVLTPTDATLNIAYTISAVKTIDVIELEPSGNQWIGTWSSTGSDVGQIDWFILGTGADNAAVNEGSFALVKNKANPDPT
jgi:hypothetical protein